MTKEALQKLIDKDLEQLREHINQLPPSSNKALALSFAEHVERNVALALERILDT